MLISIVVPMFNSSKYLGSLFSSINLLKNKEAEVILVDDGSQDDTYEKCLSYKEKYNNFYVVRNTNHGVSYSRNYGIEHAAGEYIMFVDSDDKLIEGWYDTVVSAINRSKNADIIVFSEKAADPHPKQKDVIRSIVGVGGALDWNYPANSMSKLFRREFLNKNKIRFNELVVHGEDALFNIEAFLRAEYYHFYGKSVYSYYIHCSSVTHKYDEGFLDSNKCYISSMAESLGKSPLFCEDEIDSMLNYSFANSVYIYAGKVSKLEKHEDKVHAVSVFYDDSFYREWLTRIKTPGELPLLKRIVYIMIKCRRFLLLERIISLVPRKHTADVGYWINI